MAKAPSARSFRSFVLATIAISAVGVSPLILVLAGAPFELKTLSLLVSQISAYVWALMMLFGFVLFGRRTGWLLLEVPAALCGLWLLPLGFSLLT